MKRLFLFTLFILALRSTSLGQETPINCPSISVSGPAGIVSVGELASYTATVGTEVERYSVEYVWTLSAGRIKDGQGTTTIRVIQPNASILATVEVRGLPAGCPAAASEWASHHASPLAEKIYDLGARNALDDPNLAPVVQVLLDNPNNQLFILAGDVGRKNSLAFQQKQSTIREMLVGAGISPDRITISSVYSDVELFQFWRVPPGANNPRCEECEEAEKEGEACPSIAVTGPAGVTQPGESMEYTGEILGDYPANARFRWSLGAEGKIVQGQGTLRLRVETPLKKSFTIVATLEVLGLPKGCPSTASEMAPLVCRCQPILVDEYQNLARQKEAARIRTAVAPLSTHLTSQMFLIEYFTGRESQVGSTRG